MSLNRVFLIGRLGGDPELREFESGVKRARVTLATNENYRNSIGEWIERTTWHRLVFWDWQAERIKSTAGKGYLIFVEGRLENRSYQDEQNQTRYTNEVVVRSFQVLSAPQNRPDAHESEIIAENEESEMHSHFEGPEGDEETER